MKKQISFLLFFIVLCQCVLGQRFTAKTERGDSLVFRILSDSTVEFSKEENSHAVSKDAIFYQHLTCDTLFIPQTVLYAGNEYNVTRIGLNALACLNPQVRTLYIPETVDSICYTKDVGVGMYSRFENIIVSPSSTTYKSINNCLLTFDGERMLAYPSANQTDSVRLPEGIEVLIPAAMLNAQHIKYLELPLTLNTISNSSLGEIDSVKTLVIKDSVAVIEDGALDMWGIQELTLGNGVSAVGANFFTVDTSSITSDIYIYCRAINPPAIIKNHNTEFLQEDILCNAYLLVPRKSLQIYQNAEGWGQFSHIVPIEPPIVVGDCYAEVSWVQNFSATAYVWTLYLDENKMQPYMSLRFDSNGHLIDINLNPAPTRKQIAKGEEYETCSAAYYAFTISGLQEGTTFYYTRQSLSGDEVIDEESGSFQTLTSTSTSVDGVRSLLQPSHKYFENGQLIIYHNGKKYSITGEIVRE